MFIHSIPPDQVRLMHTWRTGGALLLIAGMAFLATMGHADTQAHDASLAAPGDAAGVDLLLRDLGYLGPNALAARLNGLRKRVGDLEELSDAKRAELEGIHREIEAVKSLIDSVDRLTTSSATGPAPGPLPPAGAPWQRHAIESGLRKSEGIRLGDANQDGLEDLLVAWEGQEVARLYLNPGPGLVQSPWPSATVAATPNVEDAVLVDLDGDGALDAVSSLERGTEQVTVAWGPGPQDVLAPSAWTHDVFSQVAGISMWMYTEPIQLAPDAPVSLVIGGKNYASDASADLGLLVAPAEGRRDLARWQWVPLTKVSWVMSMVAYDVDRDGLQDIIYTDKHGPLAGVHWLKNPGTSGPWIRTGLTDATVKSANFLTIADLDGDGQEDILATVELERTEGAPDHNHRRVAYFRRAASQEALWEPYSILIPPGIGQAKGIAVGDVDLDGRQDIVLSSTGAEGNLVGTSWLRYAGTPFDAIWRAYNIAGPEGIKYDLIHLRDLDADGDLDVLANDEKENDIGLGVFWYENPTIQRAIPEALAHSTP